MRPLNAFGGCPACWSAWSFSLDETVRLFLSGHPDDLYALSLLFPEGMHPDLVVRTSITGRKDGMFDRVEISTGAETYVTGAYCLPLIDERGLADAKWIASEIIAPLNGIASLADSSFVPVLPRSAEWSRDGITGWMHFDFSPRRPPARVITVGLVAHRSAEVTERLSLMSRDPLAAYAGLVMANPPTWTEYYRVLEDIAASVGSSISRLHEAGLADQRQLKEFTKAANNRVFGRHGGIRAGSAPRQAELMNLLEAREFVRNVVSAWLDRRCGGRLPRDRVNGGPLRFGLDDD